MGDSPDLPVRVSEEAAAALQAREAPALAGSGSTSGETAAGATLTPTELAKRAGEVHGEFVLVNACLDEYFSEGA